MREANQTKKGVRKELSKSSLQICMYVACMQHVGASIILFGWILNTWRKKKSEKENLSVNSTKFAKILKYFAKIWKPEFFFFLIITK